MTKRSASKDASTGWLSKSPGMIQCVKQYVKEFSETNKRLILLVPPDFVPPPELADDVVVMDFLPPSFAEMKAIYSGLIDPILEKDKTKAPDYADEEVETIVSAGMGMTATEFETSVARSLVAHRNEYAKGCDLDKFRGYVMNLKTEAVKKTECLEVLAAEDMSSVGGLENLKDWVGKRAACFTPEAQDFGIEHPKGVTLVGPPALGEIL